MTMASGSSKTKDPSIFYKQYNIGSVLGDGNFSIVKECFKKESPATKHAVKVVKLKGSRSEKDELKQMLTAEVALMRSIKHDNVVQIVDAFFGSSEILVVMELTEHGDLYDFIVNSERISEMKAMEIMSDIVSSVHYLHAKNIVHRDIKPENFLLFRPAASSKTTVKLCDFGLAENATQLLTEVCGSPSYVAPEVLRMDDYGLPVDIWSCGVVMYVLICQFPPFYAETNTQLFSRIKQARFSFPAPYWVGVSEDGKQLISRMLVEQENRISAEQVLRHSWFQQTFQHQPTSASDRREGKEELAKGLKEVATAVRCACRLNDAIKKPQREQAILSKTTRYHQHSQFEEIYLEEDVAPQQHGLRESFHD